MMKMSSIFLVSLLFGVALSCGNNEEDQNTTLQEELDDRQRLIQTYRPLAGVYQGLVVDQQTYAPNFPISLTLFITNEAAGTNEFGETLFRPVLRGFYRRTDLDDIAIGERNLRFRFYPGTGLLLGSTGDGNTTTDNNSMSFLSIQGRVNGNVIEIAVHDHRGYVGEAILTRSEQ